jgi:fructokinase
MFTIAGESLIDFIQQPAVRTETGYPVYEAFPGGGPYNIARAMGRLGEDVGFLCPFSHDSLGALLLATIKADGTRDLIEEGVSAPTSMAVVSFTDAGQPAYQFYREGTADRVDQMTAQQLVSYVPDACSVFHLGSLATAIKVDAGIWAQVVEQLAARGVLISLDPNVRPSFIADMDAYRVWMEALYAQTSILKISDEDLELLYPGRSWEASADDIRARFSIPLFIVTRGGEGARLWSGEACADVPVFTPEQFGDTVGAGDSFMAGTLARLREQGLISASALSGMSTDALADVGGFAATVAGLNVAHKGCNPPTRDQVRSVRGD